MSWVSSIDDGELKLGWDAKLFVKELLPAVLAHGSWLMKLGYKRRSVFWLKDTNQDVVWATHPVNMHGTPSKHQTLLRDWEKTRGCSPRPDFVKLFLPRQRPFWAFTMDSRRELLQTLLPRSHSTTSPKFIRRQSVVTLLVAFLFLRWAGEGRLCFLVLGRPKILRSSRSWSLCRAQSLSWKWAGEWCGIQAGEETPSSNICSRCLETALGSSGLRPLKVSDAGRSIPFAMLYRIRPPGAFPILQEPSFMRNLWANSKNLNLVHSEENVCTILLNYILSLRSEAAAHESPAGSVHQI